MGRILAIDYGKKRVGIAVSDPLQIIANGLTTVAAENIFSFLHDYFSKEKVDTVVIGWPLNLNDEPAESMQYVAPFVTGFKRAFKEMHVALVDERYTSVMAHQTMLQGGLKKMDRRNKALVDEISATIILQEYMESQRNDTPDALRNFKL